MLVSIVSFCLKTHPTMRVPTIVLYENNFTNTTPTSTLYKEGTEAHEAFQYIEIVCNGNSSEKKSFISEKPK